MIIHEAIRVALFYNLVSMCLDNYTSDDMSSAKFKLKSDIVKIITDTQTKFDKNYMCVSDLNVLQTIL